MAEMHELAALYQIHRTDKRVSPKLLELLESHVKKIEERIRNLEILQSEILTYHERIRTKLEEEIS